MNAELLRKIPTVQEFFRVKEEGEIPESTRLLLEAMEEVRFKDGEDIVVFGEEPEDGMYIILEGQTDVLNDRGERVNLLSQGDFIGELGLINDDKRGATVRAKGEVVCANISKALFFEVAEKNRKIYGMFMNMLYRKTEKLVTEQERIKSELAIATKIQVGSLENDFSQFNSLKDVYVTAHMCPAKEVGGDFYDVFVIDDSHICFLVADVSGKGVPAALFMSMAKIHIKNYASLGLGLDEVAFRVNNQLCYKNEEGMFVTAFICVLDLETDEVKFVNAGHNPPFFMEKDGNFEMMKPKANLVFGMMEDIPYKEQSMQLKKGDVLYLYTDGVTEALNSGEELYGEARLEKALNRYRDRIDRSDTFLNCLYDEVNAFAQGVSQADDITMLCLSRK
nr:SpoIIE family protein phosphatase [Lachnospiraceae bacterium]